MKLIRKERKKTEEDNAKPKIEGVLYELQDRRSN